MGEFIQKRVFGGGQIGPGHATGGEVLAGIADKVEEGVG